MVMCRVDNLGAWGCLLRGNSITKEDTAVVRPRACAKVEATTAKLFDVPNRGANGCAIRWAQLDESARDRARPGVAQCAGHDGTPAINLEYVKDC